MINYAEAGEEAERLTKVTGRSIEVKATSCPCDYHRNCGRCAGQGTYYELVFGYCNHVVSDGADLECEENDCVLRERCAEEEASVFPVEHPPLKSLQSNQSELDAEVAA